MDTGAGDWRGIRRGGCRGREREAGSRIDAEIFEVERYGIKNELRVWTQARVAGGG